MYRLLEGLPFHPSVAGARHMSSARTVSDWLLRLETSRSQQSRGRNYISMRLSIKLRRVICLEVGSLTLAIWSST